MDSTTAIKAALETLLAQPDDACAFVIVEEPELQKFVQFTASMERPLTLDLPAQVLSEAEFYRAVAFFRRRGVSGQEYDLLDRPGGQPVAEQFTFQLDLLSAEDAAETAVAVFEQVYLLHGYQLAVTEG